jgi:hypothetical protein
LAAVIDRIAEADTNGIAKIIKSDGTVNTNYKRNPRLNRIVNLLRSPNKDQTYSEFNINQIVIAKIFGYCPVYCNVPEGMDASMANSMFNINPFLAEPIINPKYDILDPDNNNIILQWKVAVNGRDIFLDSKNIFIIKDGFMNNHMDRFGLPLSKVSGLDYSVSNICAAMEADNVLLKKKGPLGIFSYDPRPDMAGWTEMQPKDRDEIQSSIDNYGLTRGQYQNVVTKLPLKWNGISYNVAELMTKETVRQGTDFICDRLGYPAELMSGKNATYENRRSAEQYLYQSNIIPFSLRKTDVYNRFFNLSIDDDHIMIDYDHLPILQEDIMHAGTAYKDKTSGLDISWKSGMITWNEWRALQDMDTVVGMDIYFEEWSKSNPGTANQSKKVQNENIASKDTSITK